jgi:DNA polymerase III subunit delta'
MKSKEIPGQHELKAVLTKMVDEGRLPHALLIQEQVGGTGLAIARFLTQYILCSNRAEHDACGTCSSCVKMQSATHPDVHFSVPVNSNDRVKASDNIYTDSFISELREFMIQKPFSNLRGWYDHINLGAKVGLINVKEGNQIQKKLALRAFEGGYRVFIIWNADLMNDDLANKILKNLEEPSPKTVFILVSSAPSKLLPTIISRVQRFQEEHLAEEHLADFLMAQTNIDRAKAVDIAFRTEGNVFEAMKEANNEINPWLTEFKLWMRMAWGRDLVGMFDWSMKMAGNNRDTQREFVEGTLKVIDRCFRLGWMDIHIPMEGEEAKFYKDFSPYINTANTEGFLELLQKAAFHISRNVNGKLVWYDASIEAVRLVHAGKKAKAETEAQA